MAIEPVQNRQRLRGIATRRQGAKAGFRIKGGDGLGAQFFRRLVDVQVGWEWRVHGFVGVAQKATMVAFKASWGKGIGWVWNEIGLKRLLDKR